MPKLRQPLALADVTAGTAMANKAAVLGASKDLNELTVTTLTATNYTNGTGSAVYSAERTFTETAGAGTYTGSVSIPAGATLLDIIVHAVALWDNSGTATMIVGDVADDNGYFTGVDLKATDLLAGESISFDNAGGKAGADIANSQVARRYLATARVISGIITTSSTGGSAGRTRMTVVWSAPASTNITAATKV
jgi:hypothetical protein